MRFATPSMPLLLAASLAGLSYAVSSEPTKTTQATACVASSTSGVFYDLRPDIAVRAKDGDKPSSKHPTKAEDYEVRGYDYPHNFTVNFCDPVLESLSSVVGVPEEQAKNVSAYYKADGKIYSLGQQSGVLVRRGPRLILQYKDGSPCEEKAGSSSPPAKRDVREGTYKSYSDDDSYTSFAPLDDGDDGEKGEGGDKRPAEDEAADKGLRRKSASISFHCDHDLVGSQALVTFASVDPYECAYNFEVRTIHACGTVEPQAPGSVGPGSVFAIIFLIAILVYVVGGIFYQRTVAHARGWRQLPNYSLWAGIWSFVKDFAVIATASCARLIPRTRGYRTLDASSSPTQQRRSRDEENRLIDQLDEEWED